MRATTCKALISGLMLTLAGSVYAAGGGLGCGGGGCVNNGAGGSTADGSGGAGQSADASSRHRSSNVSAGTVSNGGAGSGMSRDMGGAATPGAQSGTPSPATKHDAGGSQGW